MLGPEAAFPGFRSPGGRRPARAADRKRLAENPAGPPETPFLKVALRIPSRPIGRVRPIDAFVEYPLFFFFIENLFLPAELKSRIKKPL
jgi:hypothetical protein